MAAMKQSYSWALATTLLDSCYAPPPDNVSAFWRLANTAVIYNQYNSNKRHLLLCPAGLLAFSGLGFTSSQSQLGPQ